MGNSASVGPSLAAHKSAASRRVPSLTIGPARVNEWNAAYKIIRTCGVRVTLSTVADAISFSTRGATQNEQTLIPSEKGRSARNWT